ncbi:MAG TPA: calcium-binding protein, partial [Acetobacteraceae bacterium]|nr:calcium-binding protein [Acetobacteraceae bacterium]
MSGSSPTQAPATGATGQLGLLPTPAFTAPTAGQTVLTVGAGEEFSTLSAAIAASSNGDLIEVQAGTYTNDFSVINDRVTIEGVGGMVNLVATTTPPNDKAILVTNTDITIENVAFSGSTVPDALGGNGAGIRYQAGNMTLINDEFTDNQDGLLADPDPSGTITIDHSVFDNNGVSNPSLAGYGYTHNLYVNEVGQLTIENSVFEHANVGHEIKSRADNTTIENNLIEDTATGTASYEIDLPDGGNAVVENNTIEKGPDAQNNNVIHFGGEGIPYANSALTVSGNTFVNDRGASTAMLLNQTIYTVTVDGNTLDNFTAKQLGSGPADYTDNWNGTGTEFADSSSSSFAGSSNTQYFTDAAPHSVTLTTTGAAVVGGSGLLTVADLAGHVTVVGGAGGVDFTEAKGVGGSEIITAAGAQDAISVGGQDVINSGGADLITTGAGNVSVAITGSAGVEAGAGSNGWAVSGAADINITAGSGLGSDTVNVLGGAHATVTGAGSYLQLVNAGGTSDISFAQNGALLQASVVGGASSTNMYGGTMVMTTSGGSAGTDVTFGAGNVLMTSAGADTVQAGSGNETIIVSGAAQIFEGSGALSVYGRSDGAGATVYGAGGTTLLAGDTGNIHYLGGAAAATVISNLARDFIEGGAGHLTITGPGSDEQIAGGSGGITLSTTGGADAVTTAAGATDSIAVVFGSTILSNGTDQIDLGTGNFNVTVTGASTVQGSTGNSHYTFT